MNINTPLLSAEEMEALRADLAQPKSRRAEPVDLASGDHALRKIVPIIERRLELFTGAVDMAVARGIRESLTNKADPPDVIGPRTASGTMRGWLWWLRFMPQTLAWWAMLVSRP